MFALDLFNNDHERRLAEGAVDQLEQRRIDDLAMKMDDLVARAKKADTPEHKAALVKEFQKCKDERDSYYKIKDECMGYGSLGEAGIGQDIVNRQEKMARATPSTPTGKVASTVKNAAKWLAGKGGPGKEGPTYESQKKNSEEVEEGFQDFNKKEPYEVCLAGKCVKTFDYYEDARRFHDNWKKKLYNQGDQAKADKITLNPVMKEEEQKPAGWGEFPPKQEITIVPPRKLKSGETYQDRNKYWQSQGQAPIYKTNEMDKSQTPPSRHGDYPLGAKGTIVKPATPKKVVKSLTKDLEKAFAKEKGVKETTAFLTRAPRLSYGTQAQHATLGPVQVERHMPDGSIVVHCERDGKKYRTQPSALKPTVAEDTGSWIVYDPETKQIKKRFKTHTAGKSYARTHNLGFASSEFYFDRVKDNKEVAESAMSNVHAAMADVYHRLAPRIERHRDSFLAGQLYDELENIAELHGIEPEFKRMMAGARNRAHMDYDTNPGGFQNWFWYLPFEDDELAEESTTSSDAVERAILNRIMVAHTDLLMKFGPEKVMQAAEEVAYNVGDVDEIGTSDVSAYVNQVKQILGVAEELDEKWSQKYKSSINCANPKGFSQRAHCAGKKK